MTTSFYVPADQITGTLIRFPEEEAHHASRVIRHDVGDVVRVVDGAGHAYRVRLTMIDREAVQGEVIEMTRNENEPSYTLTLAVGLVKNRARFETMIEKAVELGASRILPLISTRSERMGFRQDRLEKIAVAALKQSGRTWLTDISEPVHLDDYLQWDSSALRLVCHEKARDEPHLAELLRQYAGRDSIEILIGPEGGFTPEEIKGAVAASFHVVHLGSRRLRSETSAIYAAVACSMMTHLP